MRLRRRLCAIVVCACAAAVLAACGGGKASNSGGSGTAATATLPAALPTPFVLGNGVVQAGGGSTYVIKSGDTLAAIASRFGVSIDDLETVNPGINAQNLHAGDSLRLPSGTAAQPTAAAPTAAPPTQAPAPAATNTPAPPPPTEAPAAPTATPAQGATTYTVQAGDIPVTIAQKFGITVEELLAANPGLDPRNMHVGDVINIPAPPPAGG